MWICSSIGKRISHQFWTGCTTHDITHRDYLVSVLWPQIKKKTSLWNGLVWKSRSSLSIVYPTKYSLIMLKGPTKTGPVKRTLGRLPRIPFTPYQLSELENAYRKANYMSSEDANKLAIKLDLTCTRVSIREIVRDASRKGWVQFEFRFAGENLVSKSTRKRAKRKPWGISEDFPQIIPTWPDESKSSIATLYPPATVL